MLFDFLTVCIIEFLSKSFFFNSYERFYNASSDPLAFYQIVFSKQDVVSWRQKVTIDSDRLAGGVSNVYRQ